MKRIAIIIPCFNEEENIASVHHALVREAEKVKNFSFEFLFIDNGSSDRSRIEIMRIHRKDPRVKALFLSRNFGPEASIQAGFDHAKGDAAILFACDLQEPDELIPIFIRKWQEGYDTVLGAYTKLIDPIWMRFFRKMFYRMMSRISEINIPTNCSGFGLYSRQILESMKELPEKNRFARGIQAWVGFKTAYVPFERKARIHGKSSTSFMSYFRLAERSVFGFSYLPLDILIYFGFILVLLSFLFIFGYIWFSLIYGNPIKGAITILVAIVFFGGINLLAISIIGKYIQVIMDETKSRPTYIIEKKLN
jgi:dolichol-phosphate mannosyltransferase